MTQHYLNFKHNFYILIGFIITFLTPIHGMLILLGLFVSFDTFFAIWTTVKLDGWKSFTSHKLWNICPKTFFYQASIILAFMMEKFITGIDLWGINLLITKSVCFYFIWIELKSIDETNMKLGNRSIWIIIKEIISKIKDLKKDISSVTEDQKGTPDDNGVTPLTPGEPKEL